MYLMADSVFNIAKGRVVEYYNRVESDDPTNSALVVVALLATGLESHATLKDYDSLGAILSAANDEATNSGYARKVLTQADLAALPSPDDTNDRYEVDIPDQTWTAVATSPGAWGMLLICYDPDTTGGADTAIIPLTMHDFAVTPDGSDIVAQVNALGFFRAA
jgi:hypothetical protein